MSSARIKAKLKESRDAIQRKEWALAREAADSVLESDGQNYNATVFQALALFHLEHHQDAERSYLKAIELQPSQMLAIQGLEKLYAERNEWIKLVELLTKQADIHLEQGDATRCGECIQKILDVQKREGARSQRLEALNLVLPGSRYYEILRTLPEPEPTAPLSTSTFEVQMAIHLESLRITKEAVQLMEFLEKEAVDKEVQLKRMRIEGAGKTREALRNEAGAQVWSQSKLPTRYEEILSHPSATDEDRREAEAKLLRYHHQLLLALPPLPGHVPLPTGTAPGATQGLNAQDGTATLSKRQYRDNLLELCKGMVIVEIPDELAWSLHLESQDLPTLNDLPFHLLRQYVELFPRSGRSKAFIAILLAVQNQPFLQQLQDARTKADVDHGDIDEDPLAQAISALDTCPESVLVGRIAAKVHLLDRDFGAAADIAAITLTRCQNLQQDYAVALPSVERDLKCLRGVALSRSRFPQDHISSIRLLDLVLDSHQDNDAIIARGNLEAITGRWEQAQNLYSRLEQAESADQPNLLCLYRDPKTQAKAESAWCDVHLEKLDAADAAFELVMQEIDRNSHAAFSDEDQACTWFRWGQCALRIAQRDGQSFSAAFDRYITSLKRMPSFAPTFAALGTYYEEFVDPPDMVRSTKCYQKAFELDATQSKAAYKLASSCAMERDWNLVSRIAERVVDGEGGGAALGGKTTAMRRHKTSNIWAWKAIGSVRLQKGEAEDAIAPLQIALRTSAEDAVTWQRLGEAYALTGRYVAALKAFDRAMSLDKCSWQTLYSIAEVKRDMGEFDEALDILADIAKTATDVGIQVASAETFLLRAQQEAEAGYTFRANGSLCSALRTSLAALEMDAFLRGPWKVVADTFFALSKSSSFGSPNDVDEEIASFVKPLVALASEQSVDQNLPAVDVVTFRSVEERLDKTSTDSHAYGAALASASAYINKLRVVLSASDDHQIGSAWADLAVTLAHLSILEANQTFVTQAIKCIKEALNHEPANPAFWMTLGNLTFDSSLKVSQHAYIRAIESSVNDAAPWSSLGLLYLHHGDAELADHCFAQSQALDPDYAISWAGQAVRSSDAEKSAASLFSHAVELSEGSLLEADYAFASTAFDKQRHGDLHGASFALSIYLSRFPQDAAAHHLRGLLAERLGQQALALNHIEEAASLLEARFEQTEDSEVAILFALAQSNAGRVRLVAGDALGAKEVCDVAISLLDGEDCGDLEIVSEADLDRSRRNAQIVSDVAG